MDAGDEYELEYEAESPPKASQLPLPEEEEALGEGAIPSDTEDQSHAAELEKNEEEDAESPVGSVEASPASSPRRVGHKRPLLRRADKPSAALVASLTRKLSRYKKRTTEMQQQLQKFYQNEAIAFLENKAQARQRQIDALQIENRTLLHQQRSLNKQIEELREAVETMPTKRIAQREELRVCREQLRHYKDSQKAAEEKETRLHQQAVDLSTVNKALAEKVKQLEGELSASNSTLSSSRRSATSLGQRDAEAVIASQEDEITRLQHRVDVMKKTIKLEQCKHEKQACFALEELQKARVSLETFHHQLFDKEKTIRSQFLEMKQLKRALKDAVTQIHVNQQLFQASGGRQVRFANQPHAQSFTGPGNHESNAQELLSKLGFLQLTCSPSKVSALRLPIPSPRRQDRQHQPRHMPCPPVASISEKKTPRSARSHVPTSVVTPVPHTSSGKRSADHSDSGIPFPPPLFYEDVDHETFASLAADATIATAVSDPQNMETRSSFKRD